jgi:Tetratricopeptide repeat
MSVLAEALSVIVRRDAVEAIYPGGVDGLLRDCPNDTFCADAHLARIGFMSPHDVQAFVGALEAAGLSFTTTGPTDICLVDQLSGPTFACDWVCFERHPAGYSLCWLCDQPPGELSAPVGWSAEQSRSMVFLETDSATAAAPDQSSLEALLSQVRAAELASNTASDPQSAASARAAWKVLVERPPHTYPAPAIAALVLDRAGRSLHELYRVSDEGGDLNDAVRALDASLALTEPQAEEFADRKDVLGRVLQDRYWHHGDWIDLDCALDCYEQAAGLAEPGSPDRALFLNDLGSALSDRFSRSGCYARRDVERAIEAYGEVLNSPRLEQTWMAATLNNLGVAHRRRFLLDGDDRDLERAIELGERALAMTPTEDPYRVSRLRNLSGALLDRYDRSGRDSDLDRAIELAEDALVAPSSGTGDRAVTEDRVGMALHRRFLRRSALHDLDRGIELLERSVSNTLDGSPDRACALNNLASLYVTRSEHTGRTEDFDYALSALSASVLDGPRGDPGAPTRLVNLGLALNRAGQPSAAVEACEGAFAIIQPDAPELSTILNELSNALLNLHQQNGDAKALDDAVRMATRAVAITPMDSRHDLAGRSVALGNAHSARYRRDHQEHDYRAASGAYRVACQAGLERNFEAALKAAGNWGAMASANAAWFDATQAYGYGLRAIGTLFRTQLARGHKESWLLAAAGLPARAAYASARTDDLPAAAQALEAGRAMLLAEALGVDRERLATLRRVRPDLAERYTSAAAAARTVDARLLRLDR